MLKKPLLLAWLIAFAPVSPGLAQELTAEDYRSIFQNQMDAFREAQASPDLGLSRGLVLAPLRQEAAAVSVEPSPAPEPPVTLAAETAEGPPQDSHWVLPADLTATMRVMFAFDSAEIAETEKPKLRRICEAIEGAGVGLFRVVGHTDAVGNPGYNERLSIRRAEAVKQFFTNECGIAADRLEAMGVGKRFPANAADPNAAENRRVEFQALS